MFMLQLTQAIIDHALPKRYHNKNWTCYIISTIEQFSIYSDFIVH